MISVLDIGIVKIPAAQENLEIALFCLFQIGRESIQDHVDLDSNRAQLLNKKLTHLTIACFSASEIVRPNFER